MGATTDLTTSMTSYSCTTHSLPPPAQEDNILVVSLCVGALQTKICGLKCC